MQRSDRHDGRLRTGAALGLFSTLILLSVATAAPARAVVAATIAVTPADGLADRQIVAVTGTGFTPGATVGVVECPVGFDPMSCNYFWQRFVTADDDGNIAATTMSPVTSKPCRA